MADPIELSPFEWSMVRAARDRSITFFVRLCFAGELESVAFQSAVKRAVRMHPFLSSHVQFTGKPRWLPVLDPQPFVSVAESSQGLEYPSGESIDLQSEIGVRVWASHDDGKVEMHFQFHHACCDGLGAFRMIEDLLRSYHQIVVGSDEATRFRPLNNLTLALRTADPQKKLAIGNRILRTSVILPRRIAKLFFQPSDPIMSPPGVNRSPNEEKSLLHIPSHVFDKAATKSLIRVAQTAGATLNDLLIRDLFLTINDWNEKRHPGLKREIRLLIPFSLRTEKHATMPAANCVSMVYMSATRKMLKNSRRLLASVTSQRKFIRKWQIEYSWNQTAGLIALMPFVTRCFQRRAKRRIATSVLTNVGRVFSESGFPQTDHKIQCGRLLLNSVVLVPPTDEATPLTLGSNTYAGRLSVAVNYRRDQFAESDATGLLEDFVNRLIDSAGRPPMTAS